MKNKESLLRLGFKPTVKWRCEHIDGTNFLFDNEEEMESFLLENNEYEFPHKRVQIVIYQKKADNDI